MHKLKLPCHSLVTDTCFHHSGKTPTRTSVHFKDSALISIDTWAFKLLLHKKAVNMLLFEAIFFRLSLISFSSLETGLPVIFITKYWPCSHTIQEIWGIPSTSSFSGTKQRASNYYYLPASFLFLSQLHHIPGFGALHALDKWRGASLAGQWLELPASTARGTGLFDP